MTVYYSEIDYLSTTINHDRDCLDESGGKDCVGNLVDIALVDEPDN